MLSFSVGGRLQQNGTTCSIRFLGMAPSSGSEISRLPRLKQHLDSQFAQLQLA